jgi:serine/threonine protein kinase
MSLTLRLRSAILRPTVSASPPRRIHRVSTETTMIGQTISHFRILEKLGAGGMGVVYKAEDILLRRIVALKFPPDVFTRDDRIRSRLIHEAQMAAKLVHRNVTVLYEVGEHEGHPFLVMEFVDGHTLRTFIHEHGPLPLRTWASVALQLCEGLNAVHGKRMIHRDIKSENILFSREEEVKIVDCGLAARLINAEGLAEELGMAGTTAYMSPEQARGNRLDRRSDIFSVGVVLYELLTGRLPFEAEQESALLYLLMNVDPPPLHTLRDGIPPDIARVVHKALEKDPSLRFQTVNDMIQDLRMATRTLEG